MAKASSKKRKVIIEAIGEAHVTASFNNIIICSIRVFTFTRYILQKAKNLEKLILILNLGSVEIPSVLMA